MPNRATAHPPVSAERWVRIKALFEAALSQAPEQREAFLTKECGSDASLYAEIVALLSGDQNAGSFLGDFSAATTASFRTSSDLPGFTLNQIVACRFRIVRHIGRGGMGEVYEAEDQELGVRVALKTIRSTVASEPRALSRFKQEVQLARRVTHPNVCRIFDIERHEPAAGSGETGVILLTMELLEGETLADYLRRRGRLTSGEAFPLIRQMAEGLAAAHQAGVIHRDFKPSNVVLVPREAVDDHSSGARATQDDREPATQAVTPLDFLPDTLRAVITDFGLARAVARPSELELASSSLTGTGQVIGTPHYMAPEQLEGREATPATDVYALGLVVYEMIAGRRPFEAPLHRLKGPAPPLKQFVPETDAGLESSILRCLEPDPAARFQNAGEFLRGLDAPGAIDAPKAKGVSRSRMHTSLAFSLVAMLTLAVATVLILAFDAPLRQWLFGPPIPQRKNLVVLPFTAIGGRPDEQALCDGFTDTVTTKLGQLSSVEVSSAGAVRERHIENIAEARTQLGATLVLAATWQQGGSAARINIALIDTKTGAELRSDTITANAADVFRLQDQVVLRASRMLEIQLSAADQRDLISHGTTVPTAYDFYVQGVGYLQRYEKPANVDTAISLFKRATAEDHYYAQAQATLAEAYWYKYNATKDLQWAQEAEQSVKAAERLSNQLPEVQLAIAEQYRRTGAYHDAIAAYRRVLALQPSTAEAYEGMGLAYDSLGRTPEAEQAFRRAIAIRSDCWSCYNLLGEFYYDHARYVDAVKAWQTVIDLTPDNVWGYMNVGDVYLNWARFEDAEHYFRRALELDPANADTYSNLGTVNFYLRHYQDDIGFCKKAIALRPRQYDFWGNLGDAYWMNSAHSSDALKSYRQAVVLGEARLKINPRNPNVLSFMAVYYAHLGKRQDALQFIGKAIGLGPSDSGVLYNSCLVHLLLGDRTGALEWLDRAARAGYPPGLLSADPQFDGLRADPRFRRMRNEAQTYN
jgi:serine/threonine protein kinase/tetratricopeptide (TPR) repeat protein